MNFKNRSIFAGCINFQQSQLATTLVSSHMGTLIGVSPDREYIFVDYPSEPILAEAAAQFMRDAHIYKDCVRNLLQLVSMHVIEGMEEIKRNLFFNLISDVGEVGELVSHVILSRCFDKCVTKHAVSPVFSKARVKVREFLQTLSGLSKLNFAPGKPTLPHILDLIIV